MVISDSRGRRVTIGDILVGEVWMASGQSNMQWPAAKSDCSKLKVAPKGTVAPIREFEVTSVYAALHPIEHADGAWKNGDYGQYSAIALAFAHKLYEELDAPIGILNCSFSQTSIQSWVPRVGFRDGEDAYTQAIYRQILETDPATPEHRAAWDRFYQEVEAALKEQRAISTKTPGNLHGNRDATWMFNGRLNPVVPYAIRGAIWNHGYANIGEGLRYYHNLHSLVRGWRLVWNRPDLPVFFHQFYSADVSPYPSIAGAAEMRLGTWLARDIPQTGMASQIDVEGAVHYRHKAVSGQRLALQALKNVYGKKELVADGPMYKSYEVQGDRLIVEFEHAEGGLVVAETGSNAIGKNGTGFSEPTIIEGGEARVKLFYLADDQRVWYPANVRIDGHKAIVTSPKVKAPRGVSYATGGVGFQPNLYNRALLPATPFIVYDHELVKSETWPDPPLKIDGVAVDPATVGKAYEYRKMPLLSSQFRDHAVLQAGVPVTVWGSAVHDWGYEAPGRAEIRFSFAGIEKTIPVTPGMREWQVTLPPMKASAEPKTLRVVFTIDGERVHERVYTNVVIGEVWYVAAPSLPFRLPGGAPTGGVVRAMTRRAKGSTSSHLRRFSVCISTTPENRYESRWEEAREGLAAALGRRIAAQTGNPVGIIFMQSEGGKGAVSPELKSWIPAEALNQAPSLLADYENLAALRPGTEQYLANGRRYLAAWKAYWSEYVPQLIATRRVPDGKAWGSYPTFASSVTSKAGQTYNALVHSFTPAALRGVAFIAGPAMVQQDGGATYGEQLSALANGWKQRFGGGDLDFVYTLPSRELAPRLTKPEQIKGRSAAVEVQDWGDVAGLIEAVAQRSR